jgi:uncharacterized protein (DUF1684 family)
MVRWMRKANDAMTSASKLDGFRQRKDVFFKTNEQSPLSQHQRDVFEHLNYFPENPDLQLQLDIDTTGDGIGEIVTIGTVNGEAKQYARIGRVHFEVDSQPVTLSVFRQQDRGNLFIPFRDTTAGNETYEVGRYVEPKLLPDGRLSLDLNLAYNPYCAYNTGWSCPIPPFENILRVPIRAGETLPNLPSDVRPTH